MVVRQAKYSDRYFDEQGPQLERARAAISDHILHFCAVRLQSGGVFRMDELRQYVAAHVPVAPDSPGRILRDLRRSGEVDYQVAERQGSLYRVVAVERLRHV